MILSPITSQFLTSSTTRNACHFNYTAVVKIEFLQEEFAQLMSLNHIHIPNEFSSLRHAVAGGTAPSDGLERNQAKVDELMKNVSIQTRLKLKEMYERDFKLFEYYYFDHNNTILLNK